MIGLEIKNNKKYLTNTSKNISPLPGDRGFYPRTMGLPWAKRALAGQGGGTELIYSM